MGKNIAISILGIAALLLWPQILIAEEWPPFSAEIAASAQYKMCVANHTGTVGESKCLDAEYRRQNGLLTVAFQESLKEISASERTQRIKAQNVWLLFRKENCRVRAMNTGSGASIFYEGCLVRETITRRKEIEENWDY